MDPRIRTIRFWLLAVLGVVLFVTGCDMAILAAYAVSPFGLMIPAFPTGVVCDICDSSQANNSYQLVFAGWGVNPGLPTCSDCADFDGTYVTTYDGQPVSGGDCNWYDSTTYSRCGGTNYKAMFRVGHPSSYIVQGGFVNASVGGILFAKHDSHASPPVVTGLTSEDLGSVSGFYSCSGGTIEVTAL